MGVEWNDDIHETMDDVTRQVREMYTRYSYPGLGEGEEERRKTVEIFLSALKKYNLPTKDKQLIDVGCGTGFTTTVLAKSLPHCQVLGVDISPGSLEVAEQYRRRFQLDNLTFQEMDVTKQELPQERYVFALSSGSLHHMSEPEKALNNIVRALERGGLLGLSVYSAYNNFQRYRMRDVLDVLIPSRQDVEARNRIARSLWAEARALPDQELADSLSHPCDRAYTFREIHDLGVASGLEFIEWCNCSLHSFAKQENPFGERFKTLDRLEQYQLVELMVQVKLINLFFRRP